MEQKSTPVITRGSQQQHGQQKTVPSRQPKFEGKCEHLKGHIYDCSDARQSNLFVKTTKEIAEYVGRTSNTVGWFD